MKHSTYADKIMSLLKEIDSIQSVSEMKIALSKLSSAKRKSVILLALQKSRFQHIWSYFAKEENIPESEWPEEDEIKLL